MPAAAQRASCMSRARCAARDSGGAVACRRRVPLAAASGRGFGAGTRKVAARSVMDTNAAPVISPLPDNISASGARRLESEAGAAHAHLHHKASLPSEDAEDPLDGLREQSLRKETGEAARYHERQDHAAARAAKQVDTPVKPRVKPTRRAGFGSMSACPAATRGAMARRAVAMRRAKPRSRRCAYALHAWPRAGAALTATSRHAMTRAWQLSPARRRRWRPRGAPGRAPGPAHQDRRPGVGHRRRRARVRGGARGRCDVQRGGAGGGGGPRRGAGGARARGAAADDAAGRLLHRGAAGADAVSAPRMCEGGCDAANTRASAGVETEMQNTTVHDGTTQGGLRSR